MVDIHSHIIPGIDDGSNSLETTLNMMSIAKEAGVTKMVATSHYYRGKFENSISVIEKKANELNYTLKEKGVDIDVIPGQEVFIDNYTLKDYKEGIIGTINNTDYMLVEFDMMSLGENAIDTLYELQIKGIKPIIAHPERYTYIQKDIYKINELMDENIYFQVNAGSIEGLFGKTVQKTALKLVEEGVISFIASDAHSAGKRCPGYEKALHDLTKIDKTLAEKFIKNSNLLLENEKIENKVRKLKKKKTFFSFLK
ncbi:protein-tyrosine phosphatase [Clostridium acetobutylicum]|uniref:protein-tyrosine-phosphatase n=1 Tax=Clostridium acetobutylicum (strain ATCC 824 / DSM 792 / JCM 1419 / IAM 19013 / LMG 5710 / NBRC 13948 / NRRL B-527 / VKM B-1787 / 2291 / W) TaxID=272562 RepID=Q97ER3_CLOAB|nr:MULTISPECIES: tyrosine-protein phosphatase [Clostridium]AAK80985.1 CPSB/CAPC ortholog, PHP family hydrolase [Clostridium acetobutylicum ATCC 824]ADZ22088.1 PHP family hydrolase [Clostridium acetobutylicum EA 2018]AEI34307.1 PHP family hydrolase [Clostridium acetobutylicum DSM 1731]AWV78604.1 exopolysaccharide biosynthesis protein [Clostridium acetobutylicum]KHD35758.1 exopolysaccharide biosynthesis protein [Clostridium acetobutylicum]